MPQRTDNVDYDTGRCFLNFSYVEMEGKYDVVIIMGKRGGGGGGGFYYNHPT
jgi:hypothetical protein